MDESKGIIREEVSSGSGNFQSAIAPCRLELTCRLWHNLTVVLTKFVFLRGSGPYQIELYEKSAAS